MPELNLGLALSGGGLRGMAHIGVLKVLARHGIEPSYVAGTSAGSIFASLYAAGVTPNEMEKLALTLPPETLKDWNINFFSGSMLLWQLFKHIPKVLTVSPLGLIKGEKLMKFLDKALESKNLRDVSKKLAITSTNIETGELVVFTNDRDFYLEGVDVISDVRLSRAIRASIAIPDLFTPIVIKGRKLVDGGLKENVPVRVLQAMGAANIVAVDLGYSAEKKVKVNDMVDIFLRSLDILVRCNSSNLKASADVIIAPELREIGLFEVEGIKECIETGEREAEKALPAIMDLVS